MWVRGTLPGGPGTAFLLLLTLVSTSWRCRRLSWLVSIWRTLVPLCGAQATLFTMGLHLLLIAVEVMGIGLELGSWLCPGLQSLLFLL